MFAELGGGRVAMTNYTCHNGHLTKYVAYKQVCWCVEHMGEATEKQDNGFDVGEMGAKGPAPKRQEQADFSCHHKDYFRIRWRGAAMRGERYRIYRNAAMQNARWAL